MTIDVGAQAERTALAWRRTSLALLVISSVLLRWVVQHGWIVALPAGFALVMCVAATLRANARYRRQRRGVACERYEPPIALVALMSCGVLTLAAGAALIVACAV